MDCHNTKRINIQAVRDAKDSKFSLIDIKDPPFSRLRLWGGFPSDVAVAPVHRSMKPLLFMQVRYAPA